MLAVVNEFDYCFISLQAVSGRSHLVGHRERAATDSLERAVLTRYGTFLSDVV
jgi:hypothetical protein